MGLQGLRNNILFRLRKVLLSSANDQDIILNLGINDLEPSRQGASCDLWPHIFPFLVILCWQHLFVLSFEHPLPPHLEQVEAQPPPPPPMLPL